MALHAGCAEPRVRALFALGFPVSMMPDRSFLRACTRPRLFVQGEQDAFAPAAVIREVVDALPEPKALVVIPGADHFFTGHLEEMQEAVRAWAATRPWEAP
jgi:alpha/beta superfamily hydrolase